MLRFVAPAHRLPRRLLPPIAALAGALLGGFGTVAGCNSANDLLLGEESPPPRDAAVDSGSKGSSDAASACSPASVEDFEPKWIPSAQWYRGVCTSEELQSFDDACESDRAAKYSAPCTSFRNSAEAKKCTSCIFESAPNQAQQAALVISALGHLLPNRAACIANATGNNSSTSCAAAFQALSQCQMAACTTNCPLSSAGDTAFLACAIAAADGPCQVYKEKRDACEAKLRADDGGTMILECLAGSDSDLVKLFCGKRPSDAG